VIRGISTPRTSARPFRREIHFCEESYGARVGAERIEKRVSLDRCHHVVAHINGPIHPGEGIINLTEPQVNPREARRRHVRFLRGEPELFEHGARISYIPALGQRESQARQRHRVA